MHQTCKNTPVKPNTRNENIYIYGTVVATSCDLNAPRCTTTVPQVRLHGSRGGVFVGHRPPRDPGDPLQDKKFYIYSDGTHTHTPHRGGADEMKMKVRWQWKWNEHYLTRTRRGERKRRGTERTPTRHTWPETGKPLKRQGKRKAEADGQRNKTSGGGEGRKRLNQPNTAKTYAYLGTRRTQPTWREENAGTHEKRDPWGTS